MAETVHQDPYALRAENIAEPPRRVQRSHSSDRARADPREFHSRVRGTHRHDRPRGGERLHPAVADHPELPRQDCRAERARALRARHGAHDAGSLQRRARPAIQGFLAGLDVVCHGHVHLIPSGCHARRNRRDSQSGDSGCAHHCLRVDARSPFGGPADCGQVRCWWNGSRWGLL